MNSTFKTDVVIVGGGPGGAASAVFLAERGLKAIIIEKEEFPRFHIGESMTGECGNMVRRLGLTEAMDSVPGQLNRASLCMVREAKTASRFL